MRMIRASRSLYPARLPAFLSGASSREPSHAKSHMFLKLFKFDKTPAAPAAGPAENPAAPPVEEAPPAVAVPPAAESLAAGLAGPANDAAPGIDAAADAGLDFADTRDLEPLDAPFGQEAAIKALKLGAGIKGDAGHVLAVGAARPEMTAVARHVLEEIARQSAAPDDWLYVTDFEHPGRVRALRLPPGQARPFADALASGVHEIAAGLAEVLAADDYRLRRRALEEEAKASADHRLESFTLAAEAQNVAVLRTPAGYALAPMHDGKVVKPDVFQRLPEHMRQDVEVRVGALQAELARVLAASPSEARETRRRLAALEAETATAVIDPVVSDIAARFAGSPEVEGFLVALATDIVRDAATIAAPQHEEAARARLRRYLASLAVAGTGSGAPVVVEAEPLAERLAGSVAACPESPAGLALKAGALLRANGGYLIVDGRNLVAAPDAWSCLKRALLSGEIEPIVRETAGGRQLGVAAIPVNLKAVLVADAATLEQLTALDPDLPSLFNITARFAGSIARDSDSETAFARLLAHLVREHDLLPFDAPAVERLTDERSRPVSRELHLLLDTSALLHLAREADYWARARGAAIVGEAEVVTALAERSARDASAQADERSAAS